MRSLSFFFVLLQVCPYFSMPFFNDPNGVHDKSFSFKPLDCQPFDSFSGKGIEPSLKVLLVKHSCYRRSGYNPLKQTGDFACCNLCFFRSCLSFPLSISSRVFNSRPAPIPLSYQKISSFLLSLSPPMNYSQFVFSILQFVSHIQENQGFLNRAAIFASCCLNITKSSPASRKNLTTKGYFLIQANPRISRIPKKLSRDVNSDKVVAMAEEKILVIKSGQKFVQEKRKAI